MCRLKGLQIHPHHTTIAHSQVLHLHLHLHLHRTANLHIYAVNLLPLQLPSTR